MSGHKVLLYFSWSRPSETGAPLAVIDDRFPAIFELRRLFYPKFEALADPQHVDQGIAGFLDHVQKPNFTAFADLAEKLTGNPVRLVERVADDGTIQPLDEDLIADADTIIVISFDSFHTGQVPSPAEAAAVARFLDKPGHCLFVCPHHDIGAVDAEPVDARIALQVAEHLHHGDPGIPPRQGFGDFCRSLLAGLGVPVINRHGLRPETLPDGSPAPAEIDRLLDRLGLLEGVTTFNAHAHLPQLDRIGAGLGKMDVLARQSIDLTAPPHPFTQAGRTRFDALLQSRAQAFPGTLLVCDTTMFSSTAGGLDSLTRLWSNVLLR